jgi:DNA-binding beta-propeller fold protein YncE
MRAIHNLGVTALACGLAVLLCAAGWLAAPARAADTIYWSSYTTAGALRVGPLSGQGAQDAFAGETNPQGIAIDPAAGKIYWANLNGAIRVANLDGSGARDLYTGETQPAGVAIDPAAGKIYWADAVAGTGAIRVGNLDGSGARTLFAGESYPVGVVIDPAAGKIYWGSYDTFKIRVGNLDGTGAKDLFTGENYPTGIVVDPPAGKLYWTNEFAGTIRVGNLDGTAASNLFTGECDTAAPPQCAVGGLAIDPGARKIYWSSFPTGTIRVGNLDGSGPAQSLFTGENSPWYVALLRAPLATAAPKVSGAGSVGQGLSCSPGSWAADVLTGFLYRAPQSVGYRWTLDGAPIAGATTNSVVAHVPGAYRCDVIASNAAGSTSQTSAPTTIPEAPLPAPILGKVVNAEPVSGTVFVKLPAGTRASAAVAKGKGFVLLQQARQLPVGTQVDARRGTLQLVTATAHVGKTQSGTFKGGVFKLGQGRTGLTKGLATLSLLEGAFRGAPSAATCGAHAAADPIGYAAVSKRVLQTLHARDNHGRFRTRGRYSAGTVRGTVWDTVERCDGTLTVVRRGTVNVFDFRTRKTVTVHAGHRYLAKRVRSGRRG